MRLIALFLLCGLAYAQPPAPIPTGLSGPNYQVAVNDWLAWLNSGKAPTASPNFTGTVDAHSATWVPPTATFASPPTTVTGAVFIFIDASAAGTCTGGGSSHVTCRWNGSVWEATNPTPGTIASTTSTLRGNGSGGAVPVTGTGTDCVRVDGTSTTCGAAGALPWAVGYSTASFSSSPTNAIISFDSNETGSSTSIHSTTSNTSKYFAPVTALYHARCQLAFSAGGGTSLWGGVMVMNGTLGVSTLINDFAINISSNTEYELSWVGRMAAGDYLECYPLTIGTNNTLRNGQYGTRFALVQQAVGGGGGGGSASNIGTGGSQVFNTPTCASGTVSYTALTAASSNQEITVLTGVPGNVRWDQVVVSETVQFAGTTGLGVSMGRPGVNNSEMTGAPVALMVSSGDTNFWSAHPSPPQLTSTYTVVLNFTVTSGNVNAASAGSLTWEACGYAAR